MPMAKYKKGTSKKKDYNSRVKNKGASYGGGESKNKAPTKDGRYDSTGTATTTGKMEY